MNIKFLDMWMYVLWGWIIHEHNAYLHNPFPAPREQFISIVVAGKIHAALFLMNFFIIFLLFFFFARNTNIRYSSRRCYSASSEMALLALQI